MPTSRARDATRLRVRLEHVAARAAARNARPAHEAPRELQHRHGTSQLPPSRGIAPRRVHSPMASLVLDRPLTLAARRPGRRRRRQASRKAAERFESMPLTHVHQRHRQQREGSSAAPARSLVAARRPRPAARSSPGWPAASARTCRPPSAAPCRTAYGIPEPADGRQLAPNLWPGASSSPATVASRRRPPRHSENA